MYNRPATDYILIMKNQTTFQVQFWHGGEAVWKPAGLQTFTEREVARKFMTAQSQMCGGCVAFRIEEVA